MGKIIKTIIVAFITFCGTFSAKAQTEGISITNILITPECKHVQICFHIEIDKKAVKSNEKKILSPYFIKGNNKVLLPAIIIQGKRAKISQQRAEMSQVSDEKYSDAIIIGNGETIDYKATVMYGQWMKNISLEIEQIVLGCCSENELQKIILAKNFTFFPSVTEEIMSEPESQQTSIQTTGERLAEKFPFVVQNNEYMQYYANQEKYIAENQHTGLSIYFKKDSYDIDLTYRDNRHIFDQLAAAVKKIQQSSDSKVSKIVVVGFSSPEGHIAQNIYLAGKRAETAYLYILEKSMIHAYQIDNFNGMVNWQGLRKLVDDSEMPHRQQVLDIIDNVPVLDSEENVGRHAELMRLENGVPYRYMLQNFFPELRSANYIRVYYENK